MLFDEALGVAERSGDAAALEALREANAAHSAALDAGCAQRELGITAAIDPAGAYAGALELEVGGGRIGSRRGRAQGVWRRG